jgi:hypothetical protein
MTWIRPLAVPPAACRAAPAADRPLPGFTPLAETNLLWTAVWSGRRVPQPRNPTPRSAATPTRRCGSSTRRNRTGA